MEALQEWTILTVRPLIWSALSHSFGEQAAQQALKDISASGSEVFFDAALSILESLPNTALRVQAHVRLFDCQAFLIGLVSGERFSARELCCRCEEWIKIDGFLDVRLAKL